MAAALRSGGGGCGGGGIAQRWLAVGGLRRGRVVSRRAWAAFSLSAARSRVGQRRLGVAPVPEQVCVVMTRLPAGAGGGFVDREEQPGGADFLELSLFTGVEEDHG